MGEYGSEAKFSGLGMPLYTEDQMRAELREAYNNQFAKIIAAPDGKLDTNNDGKGDLKITELLPIPADDAKIEWKSHMRIHN